MSANEEMWDSIEILMQQSFWGKHSSVDSLLRNLRDEVEEFVQACRSNDASNAKEEVADILMLLLCTLYRILDEQTCPPDEIANRVSQKLRWRYRYLYTGIDPKDSETELSWWSDAKKIEHKINLMFCENSECAGYGKAGIENFRYLNGQYVCMLCGRATVPSKNNTLFYRYRNADSYMKRICESVVEYTHGNMDAVSILADGGAPGGPNAFMALYKQLQNNSSKQNITEYVQRKYKIPQAIVLRYLREVEELGVKMKIESLLERYYNCIQQGNYSAKEQFSYSEWQEVIEQADQLTFDLVKSIERPIHFNARSWDNQVVHKYLLPYPDKSSQSVIECMTLLHYSGAQVRDLTVELSNMYNCIVGCRFCASGALPGKVQYLEALDYVKQLNTCLMQSGVVPADFEHFYVSFAGIGEPSVLYQDVAAGMVMMRDLHPNVQFNIATIGYQKECFAYWNALDLPIRTLQIPLYHSEFDKLKGIVSGIPSGYSLPEVIREAVGYQQQHPMCRIKINYIPMQGVNDSDEEVGGFIRMLEPFKENISVKISFLNYTRPADENDFVTPGRERLEEIMTMFTCHGFIAYVFGSENNSTLGCGQLAQDCISGQTN